MHKIDLISLKAIVTHKRLIRHCNQALKDDGRLPEEIKYLRSNIAEAVAELQRLTNCEKYIIDEVLPVKVKHKHTQAAEVHMTTNGQLGFNFRATGYIGEVYKTQDGTEYFVLAIV